MLLVVAKGYRAERLTGSLNPSSTDPMGHNQQPIQGRYALGSGGLFGVGLGASREKWGWLPESKSDFIFAIIGEELGLVGTLCVTALYGGLAYAGLRVARRAPDTFSRLLRRGDHVVDRDPGGGEHRRGDRRVPDHRRAAAAGVPGAVVGAGDDGRARYAHVVRAAGTGGEPRFGRTRPLPGETRSKLATPGDAARYG